MAKRKKKEFVRETITIYPWMMDLCKEQNLNKPDILVFASIYGICANRIRYNRSLSFMQKQCDMGRVRVSESLMKLVDRGLITKSETRNKEGCYTYQTKILKNNIKRR